MMTMTMTTAEATTTTTTMVRRKEDEGIDWTIPQTNSVQPPNNIMVESCKISILAA